MAAPIFVAAGTFAAGSGAVTPGLPTGWAQNDVFCIFIQSGGDSVPATPSGWTSISSYADAVKLVGFRAAYRVATASESAPTIADTGDHTEAVILAFRGVDVTGSPIDATGGLGATGSPTTSVTYQSVTTVGTSALVVLAGFHALDTTGSQASGYTNATLTGLTELFDNSANDGTGGGIFVAAGVKATAGATGTSSATLASGSHQITIGFALKSGTVFSSVTPDDAAHAHAATSPTLTVTVTAADAAHAHAATNATITSSVINVDNASHAHAATSPTTTGHYTFNPNNCLQVHASTSPTVTIPGIVIVAANAIHAHTAEMGSISSIGWAMAADSASNQWVFVRD